MTGQSVSRTGSAAINYGNVGQLTLNAGMGNNTINVAGTSGNTKNTFNGGPGDDTFNVGNAANRLDDLLGDLTVNGLAHVAGDTLNVNDQGSVGGKMYTLTATTIARAGGPTITYGTIEKLVLNPAAGGSVIKVQATAAATPATINGAGAGTTLVGSDSPNIWTVTAADAGTLLGTAIAGLVTFNSTPNLTGGGDTDLFRFEDGQSVSGSIDGGGGTNTLDYGAYTSNVIVDLPLAQATGVGGTVTNIQNATGGNGTGYNILVGNGGNVLTGGGARNLLIAGASASTLNGGNNDDILIGGTTSWDLNLIALMAIMNEWTTPGESYATRVGHLMNGGGANDPYRLNAMTVTSNGGHNSLFGGMGLDLFFGSLVNDTTDRDPSETFVSI